MDSVRSRQLRFGRGDTRPHERTRIAGGTPLHYLIADATGDAATIEYLGGKLVVHRASLPGDVTTLLEPYDAQRNRDLVVSSYATTSLTRNQSQTYAIQDAEHAEAFTCAGPRRRSSRK